MPYCIVFKLGSLTCFCLQKMAMTTLICASHLSDDVEVKEIASLKTAVWQYGNITFLY
jgi:hypothetical protein